MVTSRLCGREGHPEEVHKCADVEPALSYTYDWHESTGFFDWLMPTILGDIPRDKEAFEELSEATDRWTNVELKITISGYEVDAKAFMERIEQTIESASDRAARRKVAEIGRFTELEDALHDITVAVKREVLDAARKAGINVDTEDW